MPKKNKITYGNGYVEGYVYNDLEFLKEIWYTKGTEAKTLAYSYEYTADGQYTNIPITQTETAQYLNTIQTIGSYHTLNNL